MEELVTNQQFWRGKSVLVTGHTGFKGAWLSLWLQQLGAKVIGYALAPESPNSLFSSADIASGVEHVLGDVKDLKHLANVLCTHQPDVVFHLAAQALVLESYADPVTTYQTNVVGTLNLLEALRSCQTTRACVVVTSDKCYENKDRAEPFREADPLGGLDPYSNSKACAELVTQAFRASYFKNSNCAVATARAGNVIGGGDYSKNRLIPDLIKAVDSGNTLEIRYPDAVRPWQHVLEPLRGYLILAEQLFEHGSLFGEAWNFGPEKRDQRPVRWLVEQAQRVWPGRITWLSPAEVPLSEAKSLTLDSRKAQSALAWQPKLSLEQALDWTFSWYQSQRQGVDMRALSLNQISAYMETKTG